jgi:hypothetical protein
LEFIGREEHKPEKFGQTDIHSEKKYRAVLFYSIIMANVVLHVEQKDRGKSL